MWRKEWTIYHREGVHSGIESGIQYIQVGNRGRGTFAYIFISSWTPSMPHMSPTEPDVIDCAITSPSICDPCVTTIHQLRTTKDPAVVLSPDVSVSNQDCGGLSSYF